MRYVVVIVVGVVGFLLLHVAVSSVWGQRERKRERERGITHGAANLDAKTQGPCHTDSRRGVRPRCAKKVEREEGRRKKWREVIDQADNDMMYRRRQTER